MPRSGRSSGGRSAPSGARGTHTMAAQRPQQHQQQQPASYNQHQSTPAQAQAQQAAGSRGPGLFGQMASTAAGVAVGSTVGHGLSNMLFGGGSSAAPAEYESQQNSPAQWDSAQGQRSSSVNCEAQSKDFLRCLDATNNNMDSCAFYLDQLKACQAAARPY